MAEVTPVLVIRTGTRQGSLNYYNTELDNCKSCAQAAAAISTGVGVYEWWLNPVV